MSNVAILKHGYISVPEYNINPAGKLERSLSIWNAVCHRLEPIGYSYNETTKELRIPAGVGVNAVATCLDREPTANYGTDTAAKAKFNMKFAPRSELQRHLVAFMSGSGPYYFNKNHSQISIVAGTGEGKTFCAVMALSIMKMRGIVITTSSKLRSHWKNKMMEYTQLTESNILLIDSSKMLERLVFEDKPIKYSFFTTTHDTLNSYGKKYGWDALEIAFLKLGIGVTIIDEVHRDFANTVRILTHTNTRKYLLLTATFGRSEHEQKKVYLRCFDTVPQYDQDKRMGSTSQKHIVGFVHLYSTRPDMALQLACESRMGFNKFTYAKQQLEYDKRFFDRLDTYVDHLSVKGKMKTLIFCSAIASCMAIANFIANKHPEVTVGQYHSKVKLQQDEKDKLLDTCDVVVTTSGSLAEGADVDGLHCVINLESFSSEIQSKQMPGRLRNLNDGRPYYYIDLVDVGYRKAKNQYNEREKVYLRNFGELKVYDETKKKR